MFSSKKFFFVICVALNIVNLNCDKKLWSSSYGPNFEPDFPRFTPFSNDQFINVESDVSVSDGSSDPAVDNPAVDTKADESSSLVDRQRPNDEPQYFYSEKVVNPLRRAQFSERIQPLKNFVMGLYQNYRSTYHGNNTMYETSPKLKEVENKLDEAEVKEEPTKRKRKTKKKSKKPKYGEDVRYNVGPGVNVSLDHEQELVNVYLDEDCLKDVFTGIVSYWKIQIKVQNWTELPFVYILFSGRGKKYDLISKILPLFILPFLIQSAIVPFVVSTLKLLLVKSIVVGKIAIFLLIISAFKNHGKYSFDVPPAYYVDPPSRRSEAAGYRVEGKPTTWVT